MGNPGALAPHPPGTSARPRGEQIFRSLSTLIEVLLQSALPLVGKLCDHLANRLVPTLGGDLGPDLSPNQVLKLAPQCAQRGPPPSATTTPAPNSNPDSIVGATEATDAQDARSINASPTYRSTVGPPQRPRN